MAGKQAKILSDRHVKELLFFANLSRHPDRNRLMVLLSVKAGLRAAEIANLTWPMVLDPSGSIGRLIELCDWAAKKKKKSGRRIPIHLALARELKLVARVYCNGHRASWPPTERIQISMDEVHVKACSTSSNRRSSPINNSND